MTKSKLCKICKKEKSLHDFNQKQSKCKSCQKKYDNRYYNDNIEKILKYKKQYRNLNKNEISNYLKFYYKKNKSTIKQYNKKYYIKNKEFIINKKNINLASYLWHNALKRANIKNIKFTITIDDVEKLIPKNLKCYLLEINLSTNNIIKKDNSFTIDRKDSTKGYIKDNIQIISDKANRSKNNATIAEYNNIVKNLQIVMIFGVKINNKLDYKSNLNLKKVINNKKYESKIKNLNFNLDVDYLKKIFPIDNRCILSNVMFINEKNSEFQPTLDRLIPNKGYVKGNVIFVSRKANLIKNNLSLNEMKLLLKNWKNNILKSNSF